MDEFYSSVIPPTTTLLGQELQPLSIGHLLYLERLDCLPVSDPERLITAVIVCSRRVEDILPTFRDKYLSWRIAFWRWRIGSIDWDSKYKIWNDFYSSHTRGPLVVQMHEPKNGDSDTPFVQHLKVTLQARLNYTPTEAINCPFGQAIHDYYAYHEIEGNVSIVDREESKERQQWMEENKDDIIAEARRIHEEEERKAKERNNGL